MPAPWRDEYLPLSRRFAGWLWRRWRPACEAFRVTREDFDQLVLGAVWEALAGWDEARSAQGEVTGPYLAQQARMRVGNHLRAEIRQAKGCEPGQVGFAASRDPGPGLVDARHDAGEVLRLATPRHRELFEMVADGLSLREAAAELGLGRSRAQQLFADARRRARRQLGCWEGEV